MEFVKVGKNYLIKNRETDLIDSIDMNLNYSYTATKDANIKYKYRIVGVLGAYYTSNGIEQRIWEREYELKPMTEATAQGKEIKLNEHINIDVDTYNRLLNEYTEEKKELLEKIKILEEKEINIKNIKYNFKQFEERIKSLINEYNSDNFVLTKDIITKLISRIEVGYKKKVLSKTIREILDKELDNCIGIKKQFIKDMVLYMI